MNRLTIYYDPALGNALQRFADAFEARKQREAARTAQETARRLGEHETEENTERQSEDECSFEGARRA